MGYVSAYDAASLGQAGELMSKELALELHLTSNHYPPVSVEYVPACKQAINTFIMGSLSINTIGEDVVYEQLENTLIDLPNGQTMNVLEVVQGLHLEAFIDVELEALYEQEEHGI